MILENFFARLIGQKIAAKLNLQEGPMGPAIPWYKSKTIWSDVVTMVITIYGMINTNIGGDLHFHLPAIPGVILTILAALGVYGRTTATAQIG